MTDPLAPGGSLSAAFADYEDRPQQRAMAAAVSQALTDSSAILIEAGTGTGKTLAYLIPAVHSGLRVVVSTGTKTLQEQIWRHDVPLVRELVDTPFEATLLKGISNYLCLRKLGANRQLALGHSGDWTRVLAFAEESSTGDRAELTAIPDDSPIWSAITTTPEARLGPRCPFYERCFVTRARRRAERAQLVVVNHHLFFADLALRSTAADARVLPDYDAVIFDEAHQLEDVITEHFSIDVSSSRLELYARDVRGLFQHLDQLSAGGVPAGGGAAGTCEILLAGLARSADQFARRVRQRLAAAGEGGHDRVVLERDWLDDGTRDAWLDLDSELDRIACHLRQLAATDEHPRHSDEIAVLANRADGIRDALAAIAEGDGGGLDYAFWGMASPRGVALHASPVSIENVLPERLLSRTETAVFTSATLTSARSFSHVRHRLGLSHERVDELRVDSPFDYGEQCLLYVPRDLVEPTDPAATEQFSQRAAELIQITGGNALLLFTSYRALNGAAERLASQVDLPLMVQGQAPRSTLVDRLRGEEGAVLLATGAFWEGIDVPGAALSLVIIDRLPFSVPTDPLVRARMRRLEELAIDPFDGYLVPEAALAFRQGFGRLIRRRQDRGIVAVLDPRIVTRRYGAVFTDSLPPVRRTGSLEQVRRWWHRPPQLTEPGDAVRSQALD